MEQIQNRKTTSPRPKHEQGLDRLQAFFLRLDAERLDSRQMIGRLRRTVSSSKTHSTGSVAPQSESA